jgi:phosphoribosyl 1,2-cyclic phosphodiesterase
MHKDVPGQMLLFSDRIVGMRAVPTGPLFAPAPLSQPGLRMCVLGSGSAGNSTIVQRGDGVLMIDAGFGPRTTARRLIGTGLELNDIGALCLTHLDQDHFNPAWLRVLLGRRINVYVMRRHVAGLHEINGGRALHDAGLVHEVGDIAFEPMPGLRVEPVVLPHDKRGTAGFLLGCDEGHIGYATDLGHVPERLIDRFAGVHLLAIESNYDPDMQRTSNRPEFLKRRIMGGAGHLSNQQAFEAVRGIVRRSPHGGPQQVVLLHRSRECNHPDLVRRVYEIDPCMRARLTLAEQSRRTDWFVVRAGAGHVVKQAACITGSCLD